MYVSQAGCINLYQFFLQWNLSKAATIGAKERGVLNSGVKQTTPTRVVIRFQLKTAIFGP